MLANEIVKKDADNIKDIKEKPIVSNESEEEPLEKEEKYNPRDTYIYYIPNNKDQIEIPVKISQLDVIYSEVRFVEFCISEKLAANVFPPLLKFNSDNKDYKIQLANSADEEEEFYYPVPDDVNIRLSDKVKAFTLDKLKSENTTNLWESTSGPGYLMKIAKKTTGIDVFFWNGKPFKLEDPPFVFSDGNFIRPNEDMEKFINALVFSIK